MQQRSRNRNINNEAYGGFIVSKNILAGKPVGYSFREKSAIPQLNGWNFYSVEDDEAYISNSDHFVILSAESVYQISPVILEIFDAPYGTDLYWMYEQGVHVGFYDLAADRPTTIEEIVQK